MKTFKNQAAQGDLLFIRMESSLPPGATRVLPERENGGMVVAHSETYHHHVMDASDAEAVEMYRLPGEIYECFLVVRKPAVLRHLKPFDTHEPIEFSPGTYRMRRQWEYTPEGLRRVED